MKKVITVSLLALFISDYAVAANHTLNNENMAISFDDESTLATIQDRQSRNKLSPQELFFLTLPDEKVIHASDFKIKHVGKKDNGIIIEYDRPDFNVTVMLNLLKGKYVSVDYTVAAVGKARDVAKITLFPTQKQSQAPYVNGAINSSPIIADSFFMLPGKPVINSHAYEATTHFNVELKTPIQPETPLSYTTYVGTFAEKNQLRRSVNQFIEAVRPRPYKPYLHYNSWMDIGFFTAYTEKDVLERMDEWNKAFITGRGVALDAFLLDDGWDDLTGKWLFGPAFSHGFVKIRAKARNLHSSVGLWLSPWGGYNKPRDIRVSHAREYGFETVDNKLALSGPNYFKNFNAQIIKMIENEHITSFKLDGMGNANSHIQGSQFASDFDASIELLHNMRSANKEVFINLTTGTNASPSWLFYADAIWRQGDDINLYGPGTPVQQWITYRDAETYRSIVRKGPLFPLNSLMYHGIISAQNAYHGLEKIQTDSDFADQVWSYFATGTQLQELYITPSLLNNAKWDTLAQAAKWSQSHASVLVDTHWVGGDPTALDVYGWASWNKNKSIISLRNPSDKPQTYYLNLAKDFEIPQGETAFFTMKSIYGTNISIPTNYKNALVITLKPLETIVYEAIPVKK
ncbi:MULTISPECIES: alpha-galactosidase [Dickeya]|uniref:Predicted exported alpha-N-acetylgalactosaminidase n=1 Tax=Dickeya aquatica TaxID=1401087 RepID=A0A375ACE2_9GAMM|nr:MULTISPECIES: enterotoxin [Dickeya]SLM63762.1 Predicted exported alpha-N-acetylgalactosaminidase [Dickeya aquatica]